MILKSVESLQVIYDFLAKNDTIAFDIETNSLNVRKGKVIGFGVSNAEIGYYVPHLEYDKTFDSLKELISFSECVKILEIVKTKKLIAWNGSFEVRYCRNYFKVDLINSLWSDGMLAKHLCDEERPFGLKEVGKNLYGEEAIEERDLMKASIKAAGGDETSEYFKADLELLGNYCIKDCLLTYKINEHYLLDISKNKLTDFYFKDEVMPLYKEVIIPMEEKGVNLDLKLINDTRDSIIKDIEALEDSIQADIAPLLDQFNEWYLDKEFPAKASGEFAQYVCKMGNLSLSKTKGGKYSLTTKELNSLEDSIYKDFLLSVNFLPDEVVYSIQQQWLKDQNVKYIFNLSSKDHLKRLFFDKLEEKPISTTDKGSPQVDDLFLNLMAEKYSWADKLRQYNKLNKLKSTYMDRFLESQEDGVFYPKWLMHGTTSGRLSGDLQQLPKKADSKKSNPLVSKYTNVIRDFFIAGNGNKLIGADYSSLEVVVFADDAGDKPLLDMIRNNEDFYSKVAIGVFNLEDKYSADKKSPKFLKELEPQLRQDSKVYSLGLRYNMQAFKLAKTLNISQQKAQGIINNYFSAYPKLKTRMDELITFAKTNGYVRSKSGRVRHLPILPKLQSTYGEMLADSLKLWEKYHDNPSKYKQMKYLGTQYRESINNCLNFPIQSMAASITNRACIAIAKEIKRQGLDATIILQIHDEIVINCKAKDVERISKLMQYLMENTTKLSVPLAASPVVGNIYGELK